MLGWYFSLLLSSLISVALAVQPPLQPSSTILSAASRYAQFQTSGEMVSSLREMVVSSEKKAFDDYILKARVDLGSAPPKLTLVADDLRFHIPSGQLFHVRVVDARRSIAQVGGLEIDLSAARPMVDRLSQLEDAFRHQAQGASRSLWIDKAYANPVIPFIWLAAAAMTMIGLSDQNAKTADWKKADEELKKARETCGMEIEKVPAGKVPAPKVSAAQAKPIDENLLSKIRTSLVGLSKGYECNTFKVNPKSVTKPELSSVSCGILAQVESCINELAGKTREADLAAKSIDVDTSSARRIMKWREDTIGFRDTQVHGTGTKAQK